MLKEIVSRCLKTASRLTAAEITSADQKVAPVKERAVLQRPLPETAAVVSRLMMRGRGVWGPAWSGAHFPLLSSLQTAQKQYLSIYGSQILLLASKMSSTGRKLSCSGACGVEIVLPERAVGGGVAT